MKTPSLVTVAAAVLATSLLGPALSPTLSPAMAQNCQWTNPFPHPSARIGESMAYDEARGVSVLFGGWLQRGLLSNGETWTWDGLDWSLRSVVGPSPRASHKMVYDSARNVVVLFGGAHRSPFEYLGDTWEWDGQRWHQRATTGPPPRRFHAMTYDKRRGVTVLYGGFGGAAPGATLDDTWEWDGGTWTRVAQSGPSLKSGVEMAYDESRDAVVLYGRTTTSPIVQQTWVWNGQTWEQHGTGGPETMFSSEMAYDRARSEIVLSTMDRLWAYDGLEWVPRAVNGPAGGSATFAFAYDSGRGVTVLWESLEPWRTGEWDGAAWAYPMRTRPPRMIDPAMVYDAGNRLSVLVGSARTVTPVVMPTETWAWDGADWSRSATGGPSGRNGHALAYDSTRNVVTLFGGQDANGVSGETWEWDGSNWTLAATTGPSPRSFAAMSYDPVRGVTTLTGGGAPTFTSGEVWEWNGATWTQRGWLPNGVFQKHAMAYDKSRNITVLAGRSTPSATGTWEYDGQAWSKRSSTFVGNSSMVYDERLGAVVAIVETTTWIWDGTAWHEGPANSPVRGDPSKAAYDIARDRLVIVNYDARPSTLLEYGCGCYADCDGSGTLDVFDFLCFQAGFVQGDPEACNCDTSTGANVCDIFDFLCFQSAFVGGCP